MRTKIFFILLFFIGYGIIISCKDESAPVEPKTNIPELSTTTATNITQISAFAGGIITSDGGGAITAKGVCWSTNPFPTINDSKTTDGSGTGSFTSNIIGLTANTTYHVRAYATNSAGTGYGSSVTFNTLNANLMDLSGAYIGQTPPGTIAKRFVPNNYFKANSTWWWHGSPVFSPDGNEMIFGKFSDATGIELWITAVYDGKWAVPEKASFIQGTANCPVYLGTDTLLYVAGTSTGGPSGIYKIIRTGGTWSAREKLNIPLPADHSLGWGFTISKSKNIYMQIWVGNTTDIFVSRYEDGQYQLAEKINSINSPGHDGAEYVDPGERFLILNSNRSGGSGNHDLYISRKNSDGNWGTPISLGATINSPAEDVQALITPDGKYFFYNTVKSGDAGYSPYWIDATFLDKIK